MVVVVPLLDHQVQGVLQVVVEGHLLLEAEKETTPVSVDCLHLIAL